MAKGRKLSVGDDHTWVQIPVLRLPSYMYLSNISEPQSSLQKNNTDFNTEKQILSQKYSALSKWSCYYDNDD